jgi:DNA-binding beta-propeller fold protein YncE
MNSFRSGEPADVGSPASVTQSFRSTLAMGLLVAIQFCFAPPASAQALVLTRTIELPAVHGRLDHMAIDLDGKRLYLAALAAGSVAVIDLHAGTRATRIEHLHEPQGVAHVTQGNRLFVSDGGGASVSVFADAKRVAVIDGLEDADNIRSDAATGQLYVGYASALAVLDTQTMRIVSRVQLAGHPEAFELASAGPQIYINVPSARHIAVVDRRTGKVTATWNVVDASQNFAMALDESRHRLFVATRRPAMLLVYDTSIGSRVATLPICGDADDIFFDSERLQLYAICGEGVVDVVQQQDADHYRVTEHIPTSLGARTGLFVPRLATLFVAVPSRAGAPAEVRVYRAK